MASRDNNQIDWTKCCLCQTITDEKLQDPQCSKQISSDTAYKNFTENIVKFHELGNPLIPIDHLTNESDSIEILLKKHSAKWHKSCKLKFNTKEFQRASKRKAKLDNHNDEMYEAPKRRKRDEVEDTVKIAKCFFCDEEGTIGEDLHEASTFTVDMRVRECALLLEDMDLVRKLSAGDMRAQDAKYHRNCLVSLYNRKRSHQISEERDDKDKIVHSIALAELIAHIDEIRLDGSNKLNGITEMKLADLTKLYKARIEQLKGCKVEERIHSTHLKNKIMAHFPGMGEYKLGIWCIWHLRMKLDFLYSKLLKIVTVQLFKWQTV